MRSNNRTRVDTQAAYGSSIERSRVLDTTSNARPEIRFRDRSVSDTRGSARSNSSRAIERSIDADNNAQQLPARNLRGRTSAQPASTRRAASTRRTANPVAVPAQQANSSVEVIGQRDQPACYAASSRATTGVAATNGNAHLDETPGTRAAGNIRRQVTTPIRPPPVYASKRQQAACTAAA